MALWGPKNTKNGTLGNFRVIKRQRRNNLILLIEI